MLTVVHSHVTTKHRHTHVCLRRRCTWTFEDTTCKLACFTVSATEIHLIVSVKDLSFLMKISSQWRTQYCVHTLHMTNVLSLYQNHLHNWAFDVWGCVSATCLSAVLTHMIYGLFLAYTLKWDPECTARLLGTDPRVTRTSCFEKAGPVKDTDNWILCLQKAGEARLLQKYLGSCHSCKHLICWGRFQKMLKISL